VKGHGGRFKPLLQGQEGELKRSQTTKQLILERSSCAVNGVPLNRGVWKNVERPSQLVHLKNPKGKAKKNSWELDKTGGTNCGRNGKKNLEREGGGSWRLFGG